MFAPKLIPGDEIRVIAPSTSMIILKEAQIDLAVERLTNLGFKVTFGKNADAHDEFFSSSVSERIEDLHAAFADPNVKGILTAIGGYNANQILKYIDYNLISSNPKVFCGYSDITALQLAIYQKTGLVTYSGPHFSSFGVKHGFEYTLEAFLEAVTNDASYEISPSATWSDDAWYIDQEERTFHEQNGYNIIQEGEAEGKLIGGNLCTMNLLQGTEFMPSLKDSILFIEDDEESHSRSFDRDLQSLLHLPDAGSIKALLIGRFQVNSKITDEALKKIIMSKEELKNIPIIANVNFGHVQPFATLPIGSVATVKALDGQTEIFIEQKE
ncbi:LD-carboxypeptidase [Mesobacillus subterraneus]|uniref:S66 family peptidase n=1 Tax=Mesobacillus subterraneus TaxID=285983 RepID=UPI00203CC0E9|nr:S66 peptidase family protein [Mesobacillus subterraneus]MCM3664361.1 LD-carboxypeptidase [Mesobacillus subterraneus]MCM3682387.1 LD-carboxypeptidase [Mesobacillus subterraneus]